MSIEYGCIEIEHCPSATRRDAHESRWRSTEVGLIQRGTESESKQWLELDLDFGSKLSCRLESFTLVTLSFSKQLWITLLQPPTVYSSHGQCK